MKFENSELSGALKIIGVVVPLLAIVIALVLNSNFRESLFIMGVNFVYDYQQSTDISVLIVIQNILSLFGNPILVALTLGI
jgi:hypothetical protein